MALKRGQRVVHCGFGVGVVRAVLDGGRKVRIEFDKLRGIPYVLPTRQLESAEAESAEPESAEPADAATKPERGEVSSRARGQAPPEQQPPGDTARPLSAGSVPGDPSPRTARIPGPDPGAAAQIQADRRQLFEALRMGVVPPALLDRYSVGRDEEIRQIRALLASGRGLMVIEGHYGTGKSHLIELGLNEARRAGYLTARVSFDAVEVPPSNPLRIYRELVQNLRYPPDGVSGGLTPLLSRLLRSKAHRRSGSEVFHRYLSPALFALAQGSAEAAEATVAFVEGRGDSSSDEVQRALRSSGWQGPRMLALPDWRTFGQILLYLVGGIACWARDAGLTGLALFFDEAEALDTLEKVSRQFAETVLRYFAAATLPQAELPFEASDLYRGGQAVHRALPHVFRADQPLLACFAFTPLPAVARAVELSGAGRARVMVIEPLPPRLMPLLAERLIALYRELHPEVPIAPEQIERLLRHVQRGVRLGVLTTTRSITRLTVEYLDLLRHRPDQASVALEPIEPKARRPKA